MCAVCGVQPLRDGGRGRYYCTHLTCIMVKVDLDSAQELCIEFLKSLQVGCKHGSNVQTERNERETGWWGWVGRTLDVQGHVKRKATLT